MSELPQAIMVWDVETTGTDIENDRILTAYAAVFTPDGEIQDDRRWIINPGVEVPEGASDVHGMTTQWIQENGRTDVERCIWEIAGFIDEASMEGYPIVGYNNSYDLSILDRELRRHRAVGLDVGLSKLTQYFDPIVYDRAVDKYRKGSRKLMDVAKHYGVQVDEERLHDAEYDVIVTAQLALILLKKSPHSMDELQSLQRKWKSKWASGLTEYFARTGKTEDNGDRIVVDGSFPWKEWE